MQFIANSSSPYYSAIGGGDSIVAVNNYLVI